MLTDKQEKFLELIFTPLYMNDYKGAAIEAGYSVNSSVWQIVDGLKEKILERVELELALSSPAAAKKIIEVLHNGETKGAKSILDAASTILDRAGLVKKDKMEVEHKGASGVFIMPSKKPID